MALSITRIPDRYRPGLSKVKSLPLEKVTAIASALEKTSATSRKELIAAVEEAAQITTDDAGAIIASLHSLYIFKASAEATVAEFIPVLIAALQSSGRQDLAVSDAEKAVVTTKFTSLLSLSALERASKIDQLKTDHQNIFYDAKILTDLRPVFNEPKDQPVGAIVTHTLKVIFHEFGEHKELYFSLDAEDISTLKKIAERANEKMASLQALLRSANIPDLS